MYQLLLFCKICFTILLQVQIITSCKSKKDAKSVKTDPVIAASKFPDVKPDEPPAAPTPVAAATGAKKDEAAKPENSKPGENQQDKMNEQYDDNVEKNSTVLKSVHV